MSEAWSVFISTLLSFNLITDTLDVLLVTYVIYLAIKFLRQTRAAPLMKGLLFLLAITLLANLLKMKMTSYLISSLFDFGVLALVVIFQPELRALLDRMGRGNISRIGNLFISDDEHNRNAQRLESKTIVAAVMNMSKTRTGALIVIEGTTGLSDIAKTGTLLDAAVSQDLIMNVFYPKSPLHDGAMIVRGDRLVAAGCVLPLTANNSLSRELGTRHRAAIGMSEASDCLVVVVSEETGTISTAQNGLLIRNLDPETLTEAIYKHISHDEEKTSGGWLARLFRRKGAKE